MCENEVFAALDNDNFEWRTINGIAKETGLSTDVIANVIYSNGSSIVKSSAVNQYGDSLYSLRSRQRQSGIFDRLSSVIKNRG